MTDAETIFELFDNWLLMVNGTENLKYKDTGMELRWNTGYTYTWEKDFVIAAMKAAAKVTRISQETTYQCCHTWEVQMLDGESIEGTALIFYTSSSDVDTGEVYSDEYDIIYLDCEETTGEDFISETLKGLVFSPSYPAIISNTKLLLAMDGADESTTFTDTGDTVHTVTAEGGAEVDTTYKQIGTGSLLLDGIDSYLSIPDHADFHFGDAPFTIDFCFRHPGGGSGTVYFTPFSQYNDANNYQFLRVGVADNDLAFVAFYGMFSGTPFGYSAVYEEESRPSLTNWNHIAIIRGWNNNDNLWAATFNGNLIEDEAEEFSDTMENVASAVHIGERLGNYDACQIDVFRITKGEALWTTDFAPPLGRVEHSSTDKKYGAQALKILDKGGSIRNS